jgi:proliferating cell nuclear antigen PCNA
MFEIKMDDARYWRSIVNAIVSLIDEGTFNISKEGISLKAMDPSGISMISFFIPNKAFSKFNVDKNTAVGLNLGNLSKFLDRSRDGEQLVMKDSGNQIELMFIGQNSKRKCTLPMIDAGKDPEKEPKIEFDAHVELKSDALREVLKDVNLVSTYANFKTDKSFFLVTGNGDAGRLEEEHLDSADMIKKLDVKNATSATFNLEYLERIVNGCPSDTTITLSLKNDDPIRIDYKIGDAALIYYLAPYLES